MNTNEITTAVGQVAQVCGDYEIRLGSIRAAIHRAGPSHVPQTARFAHNANLISNEDPGVFLIASSFLVELAEDEERLSPQPVAFVEASYIVGVRLKEPATFTDDEKLAFALVNGVFILWPYWRELVQNNLLRMNLPPISLPPMDMDSLVEKAVLILAERAKAIKAS